MTFVEDAKLREALRKPFDPKQIGKLPRKTKTGSVIYLDYVGHAAVVDRLNTVAPDWTLTLDRVVEAGGHVLAAVGTMTIGGKPMTEVGEPTGQNTYGQELQTALGNLIRRAAMRFGLGIDLWSKEELHGSEDSAAAGSGEKTQSAIGDTSRPAADEPGAGPVSPEPLALPSGSSAAVLVGIPDTAPSVFSPGAVTLAAESSLPWSSSLDQRSMPRPKRMAARRMRLPSAVCNSWP